MGFRIVFAAFLIVSALVGCTASGGSGGNSSYAPYSYDWRKYNLRSGGG